MDASAMGTKRYPQYAGRSGWVPGVSPIPKGGPLLLQIITTEQR
jgi:hypothetical protein